MSVQWCQRLKKTDTTPENIARMEREMEKVYQDYKAVEDTLGETLLRPCRRQGILWPGCFE